MRSLTLLLLLLAAPGTAFAAAWELDPKFVGSNATSGGPGRAAIPVGLYSPDLERAVALLRYADGRLLVVGQARVGNALVDTPGIALVRLQANGATDTSFGPNGNGIVRLDVLIDEVVDAAFDSQGRIVVLANCDPCGSGQDGQVALFRLTAAGALDGSFAGGRVDFSFNQTVASGQDDIGQALLVLPGDDILVGGARVNTIVAPAGRYLSAAGAPGATLNFPSYPEELTIVDIERDGTQTVWMSGGVSHVSSFGRIAVLTRLNADRSLDTGFGDGGHVTLNGTDSQFDPDTGCGLGADYAAVGLLSYRSTYKAIVHRLSAPYGVAQASISQSGSGETTFQCLDFSASVRFVPHAVQTSATDLSGNIHLAGECDGDACLWRVRRENLGDALLEGDPAFGDGPIRVQFGSSSEIVPSSAAHAIAWDPGRGVAFAGRRRWNLAGDQDFALARFAHVGVFGSGFE
jgi:uncharacterized delta-60 repeat protein